MSSKQENSSEAILTLVSRVKIPLPLKELWKHGGHKKDTFPL